MSRTSPIRTLLRRAGLPAAVTIAIGFFGYNAVLGPTGIVATKESKAELEQKQQEYVALDKKRAGLKKHGEPKKREEKRRGGQLSATITSTIRLMNQSTTVNIPTRRLITILPRITTLPRITIPHRIMIRPSMTFRFIGHRNMD